MPNAEKPHHEEYHLTDADFEIRSPQERGHTMSNLGKVSLSEVNDGQKLDKETRDKIKEALELIEGTEERANKKRILESLYATDETIKKILNINRPLTKEEVDLITDDDLMKEYRDEQVKKGEEEVEALMRQMDDYASSDDIWRSMAANAADRERIRNEMKKAFGFTNEERTPVVVKESVKESPSDNSPKKGFLGLFRKKK